MTTLGAYTFPFDPMEFKSSQPQDLKSVMLRIAQPFVYSMGPKVKVLKLSGWLAQTGQSADSVYTTYVDPLDVMAKRLMAVPRVFWEDDTSVCTLIKSGSGSRNWSLTTGTPSAKGKYAIAVQLGSGAYDYCFAGRTYSPSTVDLSKHDFISFWHRGQNSAWTGYFNCHYSDAVYARYPITDDYNAWKRYVVRKSQFTYVGGFIEDNWSEIVRMGFTPIRGEVSTFLFDRACAGVGYYLDAPGTRYDGVYVINKFDFSEAYKAIAAFPYDLELWKADDYY